MDELDLLVGQRIGFAIGKILNDLDLVEEVSIIWEMIDIDLLQILVKKAVVNLWMTNLWSFQVKNSTTNLE